MTINSTVENLLEKVYADTLVAGLQITKDITIKEFVITPNPDTGIATEVETDYAVKGIVNKLTLKEINSMNRGTAVVEEGDLRISIGRQQATAPSSITTENELTMDSENYSIINARPKDMGDTNLTWIIIARRK